MSRSSLFRATVLLALLLLGFGWLTTLADDAQQECPANMPAGVCRVQAAAAASSKEDEGDDAQQLPYQDDDFYNDEEDILTPPPQVECHVFMAPSTLGNDTNLGIFTGKALKEGDVVNYPELVVPLLFREWGTHPTVLKFGNHDGKLWDRYIWEGKLLDVETYDDLNRLSSTRAAFVPGVGCTVNSVLDMANVNSTRGSTFDTAGLSRTKDPGSGAFSPYHGSPTTVIRDVPAGSELFARYGDYWIPEIPGVQVTFRDNMKEAEEFLQNEYFPFVQKHKKQLKKDVLEGLWEFTTNFPLQSDTLSNLPRSEHSWKQVVERQQRNKVEAQNDKHDYRGDEDKQHAAHSVVQSFLRQQQVRPLSWLYEHGYCQDHLRPGRSLMEQAGRGAFAARDLPKGAIVGYAPLIHIGVHGRDIWTIDYNNNVGGVKEERQQYDLVINYAFFHPNSTVLLTPYGGMVNYINHNRHSPNVKVRWPQRESVAHKPEWLKKDVFFLRDTIDKVGLSFEYVALRDIKEGEEVVMDYGPEFDAAWQRHLRNWQPLPDADRHQLAENVDEPYLRTIYELGDNPYPPNVGTLCLPSYTTLGVNASASDTGKRKVFKWLPPRHKKPEDIPNRNYCIVTERNGPYHGDDEEFRYTYTVDIKIRPEEAASSWVRVTDMTEEGVKLYDLAFSHDWHMPNAFRHPIGIPHNIMPRSWMNGPQDPY